MFHIKHPNYSKIIKNILKINHIRTNKFLHMFQGVIVMAILAFFVGVSVNYLFLKDDDEFEAESTIMLITNIFSQILLVVTTLYYARKISKLVPFLFRYDTRYNPFHVKGEAAVTLATTIAITLAFMTTQISVRKRIRILHERTIGQKLVDEEEKY